VGWSRAFTCAVNPNLLSLWKLCRETASVIMFSCVGMQTATNSISKTMAIKRMICNGHIAVPRIEHLLISYTTLILSQYRMSFPCDHCSCHRMKACKTANISLKLMCFL
jgi:hypothetical protein